MNAQGENHRSQKAPDIVRAGVGIELSAREGWAWQKGRARARGLTHSKCPGCHEDFPTNDLLEHMSKCVWCSVKWRP